MTTNENITHVWSGYGHDFITEDGHESCLRCGAVYHLVADAENPTYGTYQAANGDDPRRCTHDTSLTHGEDGNAIEKADCNCLHCK